MLERVAHPKVPVFQVVQFGVEATMVKKELALEKYRLDGHEVVMPQQGPAERLTVYEAVQEVFIDPGIFIDDLGFDFVSEAVNCAQFRLLGPGCDEDLQVVCVEQVVVV